MVGRVVSSISGASEATYATVSLYGSSAFDCVTVVFAERRRIIVRNRAALPTLPFILSYSLPVLFRNPHSLRSMYRLDE